jgi:uncharacterized protein YkwD
MKNMKKASVLCFAGVLACAIIFGGAAYAASESEKTAAAYLAERGVYEADKNGDLNLDQNLTRADLAMILTRMDFATPPGEIKDWRMWGEARFSDPAHRYHPFTDVPDSVLPYVEYCYELGYMRGVSADLFDPQSLVNPKMASVVLLRYCRVAGNEFSFDTAVDKARSLSLIPDTGLDGAVMSRGTMADMTVRAMEYYAKLFPSAAYPALPAQPDASPNPDPTPAAAPEGAYTQEELEAIALEAVRLTNVEREKAGVPALRVMPELMASSMAKARDFTINHYFDHESPVYGNVQQMLTSFGIRWSAGGENIAVGASAESVVARWMDSEGHKKNILNTDFTHIGIGLAPGNRNFVWAQQFIKAM